MATHPTNRHRLPCLPRSVSLQTVRCTRSGLRQKSHVARKGFLAKSTTNWVWLETGADGQCFTVLEFPPDSILGSRLRFFSTYSGTMKALRFASLIMFHTVFAFSSLVALGDEGMYLFNDLPTDRLKSDHNFVPSTQWADHLRLSSVRFNSGGSGSFISSDGLVLTNHHVASDTLHKLSTPERNLIDDGFLATSTDQELKAPDLELNQLVSIEDVTDKVNDAVDSEVSAEDAAEQRRAVIARIEKASKDETGLRSDVVTLFGGGKYQLYRYKKYTDVRLVWAPETAAAFFGGDADNFEYPRYNLDATIMRVYEDGKPAKLHHFLSWSTDELTEGELVFVSGNPGRTQRIFTVAALKFLRDDRIPYVLDYSASQRDPDAAIRTRGC